MKKIITYLTAVSIFYGIFTPMRLYFDGGQALTMLIPTILIFLYDGLASKKSFWPMALYVSAAFLTMIMGSSYFKFPGLLNVVFAFACFEHFLLTRDTYFAKIITITLYSVLLVMVVSSLPLFISTPNLSRIMIDTEGNVVTNPLFYWTLSYTSIHSLPIFSIPVFYLYRNTKKKLLRIAALTFFAAIFVLMIFADSTGALLVNIGIFGVLLLYNQKKSLRTNVYRSAALGVGMFVFLNNTILTGILIAVQPIFAGSSTYSKIDDIIYMLQRGKTEGDLYGREQHFDISWKSFTENPMLPTIENEAYSTIGGHNYLFDQIVALGLFMGMFFIWFLIDRIKRPWKYLTFTTKPYYIVGVLALLVMGFMKNYFLLFPTCCILPMVLIAAESDNLKLNIRKK